MALHAFCGHSSAHFRRLCNSGTASDDSRAAAAGKYRTSCIGQGRLCRKGGSDSLAKSPTIQQSGAGKVGTESA
eukprot:11274128-Alexandrium_andersonii.AAC.1